MDHSSVPCMSIRNNNYVVQNVPGDGDCFFHCLSLSAFHDLNHTSEIRQTVCGEILRSWGEWQEKVKLNHGSNCTKQEYANNMLNKHGWACASEIEAAAQIFDRSIVVWLSAVNRSGEETFIYSSFLRDSLQPNIELLLLNSHFLLLTKVNCSDYNNHNDKTNEDQVKSPSDRVHANSETSSNADKNPDTYTFSQFLRGNINGADFFAMPLNTDAPHSEHKTSTKNSKNKRHSNVNSSELSDGTQTKIPRQSSSNLNTSKPAATAETKDNLHCLRTHTVIQGNEECQFNVCRKLGVWFEAPQENETKHQTNLRKRRNKARTNKQQQKLGITADDLPDPPPATTNKKFDEAMDAIRAFELEQMNYSFFKCTVCNERRLNLSVDSGLVCKRCSKDKHDVKMFSDSNNMNPCHVPDLLLDLSIVEQQLIARISPCLSIHMLKHGGIGASGHCITFPQEVNEPAQILPRLPEEVQIIKIRKRGKNDSSKDFRIRRKKIQYALLWLKHNNSAYNDITISNDRLQQLPEDDELANLQTVEISEESITSFQDNGPAENQINVDGIENCSSSSGLLFPDKPVDVKAKVENVVSEILGEKENFQIEQDKRGTFILPWPSRGNTPLSEFTTQHFFTLAFPCLFPFATGDFHINRPRTCTSLGDWAEHLLWYDDGRFAKHKYFKFVVHNMIQRHAALSKNSFIVKQNLGDPHLTAEDLKAKLQSGDTSIAKKILYFSDTLRGTSQYWARRCAELRALVQYKIHKGEGLPSFFTTGSCAEFHFKPLKRLLQMYIFQTTGQNIDVANNTELFQALQDNTHIVAQYFDFRTQSYFTNVMGPVFGINCYWYRQEFAKSRGMVHWHGLCWRHDREPHNLLHQAVQDGLSEGDCADVLAEWAKYELGLSANHPAGSDENGTPRTDKWPPPEGTAPAPPEEKKPLVKLLMDVSESQSTLLEDYLLLCNKFNLHRCSDYCLRTDKHKKSEKKCRMEFGTETNPGKSLRIKPAIVLDKNKAMRLEMPRDHSALVQHSRFHTQGWRANGDISLILSKSDPENPDVNDIVATERYITGYACKGNQSSDSLVGLFHNIVDAACEQNDVTAKAVCNRYLMNTIKRDISAVEASHEISRIPLFRCSQTFQSVGLSGFRVLEKDGSSAVTKNSVLDQYLARDNQNQSSFYSFICNRGKVPVFSFQTQASWPLDDDFCKHMMLLHWPNWRAIQDIKCDSITWTQVFETFLASDACPNFLKANVERAQREALRKKNEVQDSDSDADSDIIASNQPEWMGLLKPGEEFDVLDENLNFDDGGPDYDWNCATLNYELNNINQFFDTLLGNSNDPNRNVLPDVQLSQMNSEQLFCFNIIMHSLKEYNYSPANFNPIRLVVSGTAGSGKSFLIKCIVKAVRTLYNDPKSVQVVCPTGSSANVIGGVTLHSFLKVPTTSRGQDMSAPEGFVGDLLQENLLGLKVLLLDERSLVGATTLGWMEFMCKHGMAKGRDSDQLWGGLPIVVFFGDDIQLPPVSDFPVYKCTHAKSPAALHGALVWQSFEDVVHLSTIVRQKQGENQLREVLTGLRNYTLKPEQVGWLQQFQWKNLKGKYGSEFIQDVENRALFIFPSNQEVRELNTQKLKYLNETFPVAKILAANRGSHASNIAEDKCSGLPKVLYISKQSKVMLTANLCVKSGLFNGALGVVVDILYKNGTKPPDCFPQVVMVEFPGYTGPSFTSSNPKVVPITPVERRLDCYCHNCKRKQLPLRLGWATTIHKCQGMTIGEGETNRYICIHPGTRQFESRSPGALFVALSRAKSAGSDLKYPDFIWHSSYLVNEDRFCYVVKTPTTEARKKEINRLQTIAAKTKMRYSHLLNNRTFLDEYQVEE